MERTGSPPRVQTIPFSTIEEIEQERGGADYLADVNIQACSRRTRIAYGKESTDTQSSPQNLSPETQRRRSSFFASTRYNSSKDLGPREGRQELDSPEGQASPSLESETASRLRLLLVLAFSSEATACIPQQPLCSCQSVSLSAELSKGFRTKGQIISQQVTVYKFSNTPVSKRPLWNVTLSSI